MTGYDGNMKQREYRGIVIRNRQGGANDWFVTIGLRTRWGFLDEIRADIDHYFTFGKFPDARLRW